MNRAQTGMLLLTALSVLGVVPCVQGAEPGAETLSPAIVDVAMIGPGTVVGQVLDPQGVGVAKTAVSFRAVNGPAVSTVTDEQGHFTQAGLGQGGVYEVAAAEGRGLYRVWQPGTAPPSAQSQALVVAGRRLVRGQGGKPFWSLTNPVILGGIVGAAVAIPVATYNNHNGPVSP